MAELGLCVWKMMLCWPTLKGNTLGSMGLTPGGRGRESPPRPFTTDHCQPFNWLPEAKSVMSFLPLSAETMNDPVVESRDLTLHQTTQLLRKGMLKARVAFPSPSSVENTNWPPEA